MPTAIIENGRVEQYDPQPEVPTKKPRKNAGIPTNPWLKHVEPKMLTEPYMMGIAEGFPEGLLSNEYAYEKIAKLFVDQAGAESEEAAIALLRKAWSWRQTATSRQKKMQLEQLKIRVQEDMARVEAMERELTTPF